jgi:hypothetical protein
MTWCCQECVDPLLIYIESTIQNGVRKEYPEGLASILSRVINEV